MLLMIDGTDALSIVNLDNLEVLLIEDPKAGNPAYRVMCGMVSGKRVSLFRGNKSECAAMVRALQGYLASNQDVLQISQFIPDA